MKGVAIVIFPLMLRFMKQAMSTFNYYDSIASIYDQTRWMTDEVAEDVADTILDLVQATSETSFLEPGVGTGLNVLPLVKRGYPVTGIDVSGEMLDQLRQKFGEIPQNLTLIQTDASQLPLADQSFDVVLTVHMVHTVADCRRFLDEIDRVLKPGGFYLNAQWVTPPARKAFEAYFRTIAAKHKGAQASRRKEVAITEIDINNYFSNRGYRSQYLVAKEWTVSNTVGKLLNCFRAKAYGLCWRIPDETFNLIMHELEALCIEHYGSLQTELSSQAKFEIWVYTTT